MYSSDRDGTHDLARFGPTTLRPIGPKHEGGLAGTDPVNGFRGQPPMDLAPLSSSNIAPSTAEPVACRSMDSASSARPPGARVRRTPATATEGPSVFGAQGSHGAPRGLTWVPDSEPSFSTGFSTFPRKSGNRACPREATSLRCTSLWCAHPFGVLYLAGGYPSARPSRWTGVLSEDRISHGGADFRLLGLYGDVVAIASPRRSSPFQSRPQLSIILLTREFIRCGNS